MEGLCIAMLYQAELTDDDPPADPDETGGD